MVSLVEFMRKSAVSRVVWSDRVKDRCIDTFILIAIISAIEICRGTIESIPLLGLIFTTGSIGLLIGSVDFLMWKIITNNIDTVYPFNDLKDIVISIDEVIYNITVEQNIARDQIRNTVEEINSFIRKYKTHQICFTTMEWYCLDVCLISAIEEMRDCCDESVCKDIDGSNLYLAMADLQQITKKEAYGPYKYVLKSIRLVCRLKRKILN